MIFAYKKNKNIYFRKMRKKDLLKNFLEDYNFKSNCLVVEHKGFHGKRPIFPLQYDWPNYH